MVANIISFRYGLVVQGHEARLKDASAAQLLAVQFDKARWRMAEGANEGRLTYREEIIEYIESTPEAFIGLFKRDSFGHRHIHVR